MSPAVSVSYSVVIQISKNTKKQKSPHGIINLNGLLEDQH